ncbi:MAG: ATP-binding protein [Acidobacteriota bacterium]|nr:ATP-binding protein [Acidobacteriota bacterium]
MALSCSRPESFKGRIARMPILCLVVGVPASGKTSLARELARRILNAAYISKDLIQTPFTDSERISGRTYAMIQEPTFHILLDFAAVQLSLGKAPIIDAPFSVNHGRDDACRDWVPAFKATAQAHQARLAIVRCVPPSEEILKERIRERLKRNESKWDRWKLDHWPEFAAREPIRFPIPHDDVFEFLSGELFEARVKDVLTRFLGIEEALSPPD